VSGLEKKMAVTTPEWLTLRGGNLVPSRNGLSWLVYFDKEPQYLLMPIPAEGKFACRISQTINGRRLDGSANYPTLEDAVRGGLDELRKTLGW
jgi:hypothetical protein